MRPVVLSAWKDEVIELAKEHLPDFSYVEKHDPGDEKNLLKLAWQAKPGLLCGIAFRPLDESFDAFVGWSTTAKFPYSAARRTKSNGDIWDFNQPAVMVPSIIVAGRSGSAAWNFWNPSDELLDDPESFAKAFAEYCVTPLTYETARDLVSPSVAAAVQELKHFGISYLQRRIEE